VNLPLLTPQQAVSDHSMCCPEPCVSVSENAMVSQTTCVKSSVLKHFDSFTTLATFRSAIAACNILRAIKGADAHAAQVA
jgi:hypothetical protein